MNTFGVSYTYLREIADLDLSAEWKNVDVPVLVTWGTSDPTTTAEESHYLVDMINSFHPGRASYAEFPGMGHGMDLSPSPRAWLEAIHNHQHGKFDQDFLDRVEAWLRNVLQGATGTDWSRETGDMFFADCVSKLGYRAGERIMYA